MHRSPGDPVVRRSSGLLRDRLGAAPTVVASAPGRVNLVGGHTDHQEGFVLPLAVDRRTAVAASPRDDRRVRVYSAAFDETVAFSLDGLSRETPAWTDYVRGVCAELGPSSIPGADLAIASDVPLGAGLSSSAALEVAVAAAFDALVVGGDEAAVSDASEADPPWPGGRSRESLATACWRAETGFVGVACGVMDQYAAACSRAGHALSLDCRTRTVEHVLVPEDLSVIVVDTTVSHDLATSAYDDRVRECEAAAATLSRLLGRPVETLRDVSLEELATHAPALPEPGRSRASHVVSENARVLAAREALREGELTRLGGLVSASHASLRDDFAVSCPELDRVVTAVGAVEGVHGARMTGGGFGGSVVVLARPDATGAVGRAVTRAFDDPGDPDPDVYATGIGHGVEVRRVAE